ncbi:MAG: ABC transporter permease [Planctomycetota bacterium]|jgi:putative ABC transport system permease protein|nr:ABC transporter permease [Planctomycetota bacterium]
MSGHLAVAWGNARHFRRQTGVLVLFSLCAMLLAVVGLFPGHGLGEGLTAAVRPFDLLVGRGGSQQMVISTVFLQDYPAGNLPYRLVEELRADPRVESAVPLAFGDSHRGYRLIGTEAGIFSWKAARGDPEPWLGFAEGRSFSPGGREAVLGARAARDLGLKIGDLVVSAHGMAPGGDEHEDSPYRVTGILASCRGPYDRAILVDIESVWEAHGIPADPGEGSDRRQATVVMVKPAGYVEAYQLAAEFSGRPDADLVFPAQAILRLLSLLGQADWLFRAVGLAACLLGSAILLLSLYWSGLAREREMETLRLLGAERGDLALIRFWEGVIAVLPGLIAGSLLGHGLLRLAAGALESETSLHAATGYSLADLLLFSPPLLACLAAGGLAAARLARKSGFAPPESAAPPRPSP